MLKGSSLCLYSSNLGTFWLKIEQFWPFEEISIFSNGGHLGYRTALTDTIFKGDHLRIISAKFGWNWLSSFRGEDSFKISSPLFSILSLAAILVGSRHHRTQFWRGPLHQSLVAIGPVVSEEKIFMWISHRVLCTKFGCGGHLGRRAKQPDTFLEENHPMTISSKFSSYSANGFRQEDFYGNFS